jgi:hypothetical protein
MILLLILLWAQMSKATEITVWAENAQFPNATNSASIVTTSGPYHANNWVLFDDATTYVADFPFIMPWDMGLTGISTGVIWQTPARSTNYMCLNASILVFPTGSNITTACVPTPTPVELKDQGQAPSATQTPVLIQQSAAGSIDAVDCTTGAACSGTTCYNKPAVVRLTGKDACGSDSIIDNNMYIRGVTIKK